MESMYLSTAKKVSLVLVTTLLVACGGQKESAAPPNYTIDNSDDDSSGGMEMMAEFGGMNEEKVQRTIKRIYPELSDCLMKGYDRVEFLGGDVAFLVKVNQKGQAEAAHIEQSTLGDYATEQCMLDRMRASRWPKPVGGLIGLARTSIGFDPPADVRPPIRWSRNDVAETLGRAHETLRECGNGGPFEVTAYIDTKGHVLSAGIAHADDQGNETARCLVSTVEELAFPSPGSWPAKVTFRL